MRKIFLAFSLLASLVAGCGESEGMLDITSAETSPTTASQSGETATAQADGRTDETLDQSALDATDTRGTSAGEVSGSDVSAKALAIKPPAFEARSYDGRDNNRANPAWGSAGVDFVADVSRAYADGQNAPSGADRPGARAVSNALAAQPSSIPDPGGRSAFLWVWGQFLDHDLDLTLNNGQNDFPIPIPPGDPYFDPFNTGNATLPFSRSIFRDGSAPRAQINSITAFIDGSQIYGSDETTARSLRSFTDGLMLTSTGDLPPRDASGFFLCGDIRANENIALTAMQTIFLREHNRKAREIKKANPNLDDEAIYQRSRKYVGALVQAITYREFLPVLLGRGAIATYSGYKSNVDPGVGILFSSAAYRLGHSQVGSDLPRLDAAGREIAQGNLKVVDAFFNPAAIADEGGIEPLIRGLAITPAQATDPMVIDDLRNFLFGPPGAGGLDLPALNIQRGRDHGLPSYNVVRTTFGWPAAQGMPEVTRNLIRQQAMATLYGSPNQVDPWVGLLAEDTVAGAAVGPTLRSVLAQQFRRTRDGDRFFYLNDPALKAEIASIEASTLARVVQRNCPGVNGLPANLFLLPGTRPLPAPRPRRTPLRPLPPLHI